MQPIPEYVETLPNICGAEADVHEVMKPQSPLYLNNSQIDFGNIQSCFVNALHMHQPLIPEGGESVSSSPVISHLKYMMDNKHVHGNQDADVFHWCYKRMGEFIPELVNDGKNPRIMLDYSGCLLYGLMDMGLYDVLDNLKKITQTPEYSRCIEWMGTAWGHPVAPSTPVQDFKLHVEAWQQYFGALFGFDALKKVRGFSPPEMALPNHPDVAYEFIKTLNDCGFNWVMVQEHTVEKVSDGSGISQPFVPHLLVAKNSEGKTAEIIAIIKTQGSDTKLVAHMQPYHEAKGVGRQTINGKQVPGIVAQIADGENGGVMMNEFPDHFKQTMRESSHSQTVPANASEYLEYLETIGVTKDTFTKIQPIHQNQIWDNYKMGSGTDNLEKTIKELESKDHRFHMEGGSWTNNLSWVKGYDHVLAPMEEASAMFSEKVLAKGFSTSDQRYRNALFHLLSSQTSCYRYWGEGRWTDYGRELCKRTMDIIKHDM
ncbi:MAG: hypothetical protein MI922_02000 [Bacteroidales bacterium]|nr:hypothetical protein [Bacteroidales bacterium]